MADPEFDPDAYLSETGSAQGASDFDPDAYLSAPQKTPAPVASDGGMSEASLGPSYLEQPKLQSAPELFQAPTQSVGTATPGVAQRLGEWVEGTPGQPRDSAEALFEVAQRFKKHLIDPVMRFHQAQNRALWLGGEDPELGGKEVQNPNAPGQWLRRNDPELAALVEGVGAIPLGETSLNTQNPEAVSKIMTQTVQPAWQKQSETLARGALAAVPLRYEDKEKAISEFGYVGAGAIQSALSSLSTAGLYLIPGLGQGAIAQGATGGFLTGLATSGADLKKETLMGGVAGGAIGGVAKGASKLYGMFKGRKLTVPVGVVPPDEINPFIGKLLDSPETVIPSKNMDDVTAVVRDTHDGQTVTKLIRVTPAGVNSQTVSGRGARLPKDVIVLDTEAYTDHNHLSMTKEAELRDQGLALGIGQQETVVRTLGFRPGEAGIGADWDASKGTPHTMEGLVMAIEGYDGSGTARLHDISSPKLQAEILRTRGISEVTLADGTKAIGFQAAGDTVLLAPDPDELVPGAIKASIPLKGEDVRPLSTTQIRDIIAKRDHLIQEAKDALALADANASAISRDLALGGNGDGSKLPPPPPMDPPPPPPPNPHNVSPTEEISLRWWERIGSSKLGKNLLNPTVRGPQDVADLAKMAHSVDTFMRLKQDTMKSLVTTIPELQRMPAGEQFRTFQGITRFLQGDIKLNQLKEMHPELGASAFRVVEEHKLQTAIDEQKLVQTGMLKEGQTIEDALGLTPEDDVGYLTQVYWRHLLSPGEWRRLALKDEAGMVALKRAIKEDVYGTKEYRLRTDAQKDALAERHLDFLLGNPEKMAEVRKNPEGAYKNIISEAAGSLKAKKDLRWWEKAALGEIDNPLVRMAEARARQKQLVLTGEMWHEVSINSRLAVREDARTPQQIKDWVEVPNQPGKYGHASGMYVSPETWEALVQAPLAQRGASTVTSQMLNAIKYGQTVGNPGSWVTNFFGNAQGMALSNLVNPFAAPLQVGHGMLQFSRDLAAHKAAPGILGNVQRERFAKMMELGIVGSDYSTAEFREGAAVWAKTLEAQAATFNGKVDAHDMFVGLLKKASRGKENLARYYGIIDTMWKYSAAINGLQKGGINLETGLIVNKEKAIKFIGERFMPFMSEDSLTRAVWFETAQRIHYAFPMLDRVGAGVAKAGQMVGAVNPYIKVKSELMRNYAHIPVRMAQEPGMAANMLGMASVVGGMYFLNKELRKTQGINQEEVDRAFAAAPDATKRFKPGAMALPWRTAQGRISIIDLTQMFEPMSYLSGNPETGAGGRILQNMLMSPINGSIIEPELQDLLASSGYIDPSYKPKNPPEWQESGARMLGEALMRVGPGIVRNTYNTLERGGVGFAARGIRGPTQEQQSPFTTGTNLLLGPNRIQEIGGNAAETRAIQGAAAAVAKAEQDLNDLGVMREGQSTGPGTAPLNKAAAQARAREVLNQRVAELNRLKEKFQ